MNTILDDPRQKDVLYRLFRNFVFADYGRSHIYSYEVFRYDDSWVGRLILLKDGEKVPHLFVAETKDNGVHWKPA